MSRIFISYSHSDGDYARALAQALEAEGFAVFIDDRIDYGSQWPHVIQEELDRSAAFVVVMTPRAYESEWVQNELSRAKRKRKPIFPLLLDGDEPWLSVEATQYADVRGGRLPPGSFIERLARITRHPRPSQTGLESSPLKRLSAALAECARPGNRLEVTIRPSDFPRKILATIGHGNPISRRLGLVGIGTLLPVSAMVEISPRHTSRRQESKRQYQMAVNAVANERARLEAEGWAIDVAGDTTRLFRTLDLTTSEQRLQEARRILQILDRLMGVRDVKVEVTGTRTVP